MVTLTFNMFGLILACVIIFLGLVAPMSKVEGDNWAGVAYAIVVVILAVVMYLTIIGFITLVG